MASIRFKTINDYASLGWMYNFLPKTADTYENAIRCYYFAVCTCRQIDESELQGTDSCYYKDFWRDDLKINIKTKIKSRDNDRLQKAYKELSRLIFLPFLYGYEWSVTIKTQSMARSCLT